MTREQSLKHAAQLDTAASVVQDETVIKLLQLLAYMVRHDGWTVEALSYLIKACQGDTL